MKSAQFWTSLFVLVFSFTAFAENFPEGPDPAQTPGDLCENPTQYSYPEKIARCPRKVSTKLKDAIIRVYEKQLGYKIHVYGRKNFKIDHLIPLCAGGSNDPENLWPQHKSVYEITDPLEGPLCEKMAQGRLKQNYAIELVLAAKHNLDKADQIIDLVHSL